MALDKVVNSILEGAEEQAKASIQDAEKQREAILKQADEKIAAKKAAQQKEMEVSLGRLRQQELSSAELEAKRIILNAKKEILDKSFQEALESLRKMDAQNKGILYRRILDNGKAVIQNPKVFCPRGESGLISGISGIGSVVEMDMEPGLILEDQGGQVRLDYRFKAILENVWEKEMKNVSNILFG